MTSGDKKEKKARRGGRAVRTKMVAVSVVGWPCNGEPVEKKSIDAEEYQEKMNEDAIKKETKRSMAQNILKAFGLLDETESAQPATVVAEKPALAQTVTMSHDELDALISKSVEKHMSSIKDEISGLKDEVSKGLELVATESQKKFSSFERGFDRVAAHFEQVEGRLNKFSSFRPSGNDLGAETNTPPAKKQKASATGKSLESSLNFSAQRENDDDMTPEEQKQILKYFGTAAGKVFNRYMSDN